MLYMYENSYKYDREKLRNGAKEKFGEKTFIENVIKYYKVRIDNEEQKLSNMYEMRYGYNRP